MPAVEHAVIAAAGFGSRLGRGYPKCLVAFRGRTLLERQLELLADVPDVRVVVGFREQDVIAHAREVRSDVLVVRNPAYATTTTLTSYALGARFVAEPTLFLDADILFEPASFADFLDACDSAPLVGYTRTRTADAVYARVADGHVVGFSRTEAGPYEWANLAYLPPAYCESGDREPGDGTVFERLSRDLPLRARFVDSFEVDRPADLALAEREYVGVPHQRSVSTVRSAAAQ